MPKQETIANILKKIKKNKPEDFNNYSPAILRIQRVHDYLHQELDLLLEKYDLQGADFSVLGTLRREKKPYCLSPTELYHSMLFSSGGLTKVLNRVTDAGLIERIDNPNDKRSKLVKLTAAGKILIDDVIRDLHGREQKIMAVLSESEQQQLNKLLEKFLCVWE
ncbi:MAG: MarR family transcriptional regulator [Psychromonas sp.]